MHIVQLYGVLEVLTQKEKTSYILWYLNVVLQFYRNMQCLKKYKIIHFVFDKIIFFKYRTKKSKLQKQIRKSLILTETAA